MSSPDPRVQRATDLLRELGIQGRVEVRGERGDIACLVLPVERRGELVGENGLRLAERLRGLGFRFVALDLDPAAGAGAVLGALKLERPGDRK